MVERDDRQSASNELGHEIGLKIREREHEVGFERDDLVELRVDERRHFGLVAGLRRPHRVPRDADDRMALTEEVQGLGRFLGEADDALGVPAHNTARIAFT